MVYEFFYLHDELDWLDVKLHEAGDEVDKFVVVECIYDLLHRPKPLYYGDNKARFAAFNDKIIHIVITDDEYTDGGGLIRIRMAHCYKGFKDCKPDDILIVTDPDVILKKNIYREIKACNMEQNEIQLVCDWYMYYMDYLFTKEKYINCTAFLYKNTVDSEWATVNRWKPVGKVIHDAGWHFSKIGSAAQIIEHLKAYPHPNMDYATLIGEHAGRQLIQYRINEGFCWEGGYPGEKVVDYVPYVPAKYPQFVNEHPEIFGKYFKGGMGNAQV